MVTCWHYLASSGNKKVSPLAEFSFKASNGSFDLDNDDLDDANVDDNVFETPR